MAKAKKVPKSQGPQGPQGPSAEVAVALAAHEALPGELEAAEAAGISEVEFFDGSVFQLIEGVWHVNTSYNFYRDRWQDRSDRQACLSKAWDTLAEARVLIEQISPYFIRAVLGLRIHPSYGFQAWANASRLHRFYSGDPSAHPTRMPVGHPLSCLCAFVTGSGVMGFDPHVFANVQPARAASILIHEALHIQRDHTHEQLVDSLDTNNILHDLEINDDVQAMGYTMLDNFWLPENISAPNFLHALDYLAYLPKPPKKKGKGAGNQEGEGAGGGDGGGEGAQKRKKPKLAIGGQQTPMCGSGSGGEPLDAEGDVPQDLKRSDLEIEANRMAVAKDIMRAETKEAGIVPNGLLRWAQDQLKPAKINWRKELPSNVRNLCNRRKGWGRMDSRLSRPTINQLALTDVMEGVVLQYAQYQARPKILIALDTSGSMGGPTLAEALSEIRGALQSDRADIYMISFDAATYLPPVKVNFDIRELAQKVVGGGGTNVMVVYEDPHVQRMRFDSIIVLTDGYTPIAESCPLPGVRNLFVILHTEGGGVDPFHGQPWDNTKVIHLKD